MKSYPDITVVSRDGSTSYKRAIADAHPDATQVSDRFHLIQNLTDCATQYLLTHLPINVPVKGSVRSEKISLPLTKSQENRQLLFEEKIRRTQVLRESGWGKIEICRELNMDSRSYDKITQEPYVTPISKAEKKHLDTVQRKEKLIVETKRLRNLGHSVSAISRMLQKNPRTINRFLKQEVTPVSKAYGSKRKGSILQPYHKEIDAAFERGMMSSQIEQQIRKKGYKGSSSLVRHYISQKKKDCQKATTKEKPLHSIKRQHIIQLLYHSKEESQEVTLEECRLLFNQYPFIKEFYEIVHQFKKILKTHDSNGFTSWFQHIEQLPYENLLGFTVGIKKDLAAVSMAVLVDYNNGLAEGSINKIKVIKRIMYGRCSFNLLRNKTLLLERFHFFN